MNELFEREGYDTAKFPAPREFQTSAHEALRQGIRDKHKNQVLMAPTGAGKTYLGLRIAHESLLKGRNALFVCDRTTLINQTSEVADAYGLTDHGIVQANHWRRNDLPFQIASVQTLAKRDYWPRADVIIIDECHTQHKAWTEHVMTTQAKVIGLSATPFSKGLGKIFSNLVNATTMNDLTVAGVLVPMRVFSCTQADMKGAATKAGGEWADEAAAERGSAIVGDVVSEWIKFSPTRKTIVFGATIKHCEELCRQFLAAGVVASIFTADTQPHEREMLLSEYRKHDSTLRVLISVEALAKGFDVPDVGCVVDCRPLRKSLSTAIQMWGRGLRSSPNTGKTDCHLHDHTGNILRFLDDYTGIFFDGLDSLDLGDKLDKTVREDDEKEPKACPACGFKPFGRRCMACGHETVSTALVEHEAGVMQEINLFSKVAGKFSMDDKQKFFSELLGAKGQRADGWVSHKYRERFGVWPVGLDKVAKKPSHEMEKWLQRAHRAWVKSL